MPTISLSRGAGLCNQVDVVIRITERATSGDLSRYCAGVLDPMWRTGKNVYRVDWPKWKMLDAKCHQALARSEVTELYVIDPTQNQGFS